jgi:hypothetical protein
MTTATISKPCVPLVVAQARLMMCRQTVEKYVRLGELEAVRPHTRCVLITVDSLEAFEQRRAIAMAEK